MTILCVSLCSQRADALKGPDIKELLHGNMPAEPAAHSLSPLLYVLIMAAVLLPPNPAARLCPSSEDQESCIQAAHLDTGLCVQCLLRGKDVLAAFHQTICPLDADHSLSQHKLAVTALVDIQIRYAAVAGSKSESCCSPAHSWQASNPCGSLHLPQSCR